MSAETIDLGRMNEVLADYDGGISQSDLMAILEKTQDIYGYLPRVALEEVARYAGVPASHVFGVATFYGHFSLIRRGKYNIRVCRGTACHVRGGKKVLAAVKRTTGIEEGETSPDYNFSLETVACLGACALAPVVTVNKKYYGKLLPEKISTILNQCCSGE